MKQLHRKDLFGWSEFNAERNIDFHGVLWTRRDGNIIIDPVPLCPHDREHLDSLGGAQWLLITNSDHIRDTARIAAETGAKIAGPQAEADSFPIRCDRWLSDGDELVPGLKVLEMQGSKTAGELALILDGDTLVTGDLIRCHQGGTLCLLPDAKLSDKEAATASLARLAAMTDISAVLTGDGWPVFRDGAERLKELLESVQTHH